MLVRLDLNVPTDDKGHITDDRRISEALPTLRKLLGDSGRIIMMSHFGRPKGAPEDWKKYTLAPVAKRIGELLGRPVRMLPDCVGPKVAAAVKELTDGELCLLENLRLHDEEQIKDKDGRKDPTLKAKKEAFAKQIADLGDVYVNDAFGTCHRDNASMLTIPQLMAGKPRVVGYLVQKELRFLGEAVTNPRRPLVCILGGAKVSDKLAVIENLLDKCDKVLIGGAMAYTFLAADGLPIGKSLSEPDLFDTARTLKSKAGGKLMLPVDSVAAAAIDSSAASRVCEGAIPDGQIGLDIGPKTVRAYADAIRSAKTIVWNGPMGVFETKPFDAGTFAIARALADATAAGAVTIIGGGDSAAAIAEAGLADKVTHVSTGGGASLEFLEGKRFAALDVLDAA